MSSKWEYKVAYVDRWQRTSVEGQETGPEEHERTSGFARRFLNGLGADGWELVSVQHIQPGQSYLIFKRELAEGAEPDLSVTKSEPQPEGEGRRGRRGHHGHQAEREGQSGTETVTL
jgi:hypothetical protein